MIEQAITQSQSICFFVIVCNLILLLLLPTMTGLSKYLRRANTKQLITQITHRIRFRYPSQRQIISFSLYLWHFANIMARGGALLDLTIFTTQTHIRLLSVSSIQYSPNIGSTKYFCCQRQNFVLLLTLNVCRWINLCICQQNLVLCAQKMISKQLPEFGSGRNAKVGAN